MPTPLDVPFATQTDASGNAKISQEIRSAAYTVVYATAQCNGSGQWIFGKGGNAFQFQQGANVVLGPIFLSPGQKAELQVVGATAGASLTGSFWGFVGEARDGSDLVALAASVESAGSLSGSVALALAGNVPVINASGTQLQVTQPQQHLTTISGLSTAGGTQTTTTASLPSGCHCIGIGVVNTLPMRSIKVTGHTTGIVYNFFTGATGGLFLVPILAPEDSQLDIQVVWVAGTPSPVLYIDAIMDPEAFMIVPEQTLTVGFDQTTNPPPWLAPNQPPLNFNINLNVAGVVHIIPVGSVGGTQHVYLFSINESPTGTGATGNWQDTAGTGVDNESFASGVPRSRLFNGAALASGKGLDFNVGVTAANFLVGSVAYSIF